MTATIDKRKYLDLIDAVDISTKVIETEDEYDSLGGALCVRFLVVAENLMHKRLDRTSRTKTWYLPMSKSWYKRGVP
jgi:hypothetical protein